jgi:DNA-binding transcriptional regulator YiaG
MLKSDAERQVDMFPNSAPKTSGRVVEGWCAETIRIARMSRGLAQKQLAYELGCRQQTVSEWETGICTPGNAYQKLLTMFFTKDGGESQDGKQAPGITGGAASPAPSFTPQPGEGPGE